MTEERSHVGIEQKMCPVCYEVHDVGVLLHRQMKQVLPRTVLTGPLLCPEHQRIADEGRVFIVEVDMEASTNEHIDFLAGIAIVRDNLFTELTGKPVPANRFSFCDADSFKLLTGIDGAEYVPSDHEFINPRRDE